MTGSAVLELIQVAAIELTGYAVLELKHVAIESAEIELAASKSTEVCFHSTASLTVIGSVQSKLTPSAIWIVSFQAGNSLMSTAWSLLALLATACCQETVLGLSTLSAHRYCICPETEVLPVFG